MDEQLRPIWVDDLQGLQTLMDEVGATERVALDTEFHGERSFIPRLMLVQIATEDSIYLVDPLAGLDLRPLFEILARPKPLLIGHALHNDLDIVFLRYGLLLQGIFDTQIAGAFLGHGLQVGLSALLRSMLQLRLSKDSQMADWSQRPLSQKMLRYAANDVRYLLTVHEEMRTELESRGRTAWVDEECATLSAQGRYGRDPMQAWRRVSGARSLKAREGGILVELAAERDRLAQELDRVVHHVLRDEVLIALSRAAPRTHSALQGDRRLRNQTIHRYADRLLAAIARGLETPIKRPRGHKPPTPGIEAVATMVMMMVRELADREALAPALLLRKKTLQRALQDGARSRAELVKALKLTGWREELLANLIQEVVSGQRTARCTDGQDGPHVTFERTE